MKIAENRTATIALWMGSLFASVAWGGGDLTPTNGPAPTMHTLEELYQNQATLQANQAALEARIAQIEQRMATDGMADTVDGMVLIPAGEFRMGDSFNEGSSNALPVHTLTVSAFYMDQYEVTKALWDDVYQWAVTNGYSFENPGLGRESSHPVYWVNWYDCVKWANARSEMNGLPTVYRYAVFLGTEPYRTGQRDDLVLFSGGYRLPTEAEWEKAARGGVAGRRFPWAAANLINQALANFYSDPATYSYDTSLASGYHPAFSNGAWPYTSPVGCFAPNGYGLFDMTGNITEWCWDWYLSTYYADSPSADPRGPESGLNRTSRGAGFGQTADRCRVASRGSSSPITAGYSLGFRLVRDTP